MRRILVLLSALAVTGCLNSNEPVNNPSDPAKETFAASLGVDIPQMQKTASGVYYQDVTVGTGDSLRTQSLIVVDYALYLKDGSLVDQGTNVQLSMDQLITGFVDGLRAQPYFRVGGRRKLVIPSALGYGAYPPPGPIPPNSTLIFDVTLKSIP